MSTTPSNSPPWVRGLRRLCEFALVGAAAFLTVANTAAPEIRRESVVLEQQGPLRMRLDKRVYTDLPFAVELPAGTYRTLTLYRLEKEGKRKRVLLISSGDERMTGDPLRIALLHPTAEGEATRAASYLLVVTDEERGIHELRFDIVDREVAEDGTSEIVTAEPEEETKSKRKKRRDRSQEEEE
jgi:hypothetical protein